MTNDGDGMNYRVEGVHITALGHSIGSGIAIAGFLIMLGLIYADEVVINTCPPVSEVTE